MATPGADSAPALRVPPQVRFIAQWFIAVSCSILTFATAVIAQSNGGRPGPVFVLTEQTGRAVSNVELAAKPTILHFGFTHCPVICPTTLYELSEQMKLLGADAEKFNFVFVTVDPERDTPAVLGEYVENFDKRIIALSGDPRQLAALAAGLGAVYARVPTSDGDYTMDHSATAFLLRKGWSNVTQLYMGDGADSAKVQKVLRDLLSQPALDVSLPARGRVN